MALSATFGADFSSFEQAVDKATAKILSFESGSAKMTTSLAEVDRASEGTEAELQRLGAEADAAAEKMTTLGTAAATPTATKLGEMAKQARTVDGSLRTLGLNIGPVINVLDELNAVSTKSAGALGKLETAGAALSAGMAGWQLGRTIADFFGTDKIIGDFTAKLLGWGDVAGQEAAAGAETLARASRNAGRAITDMAEAVKINEAAVLKAQQPIKSTAVDMDKLREELLKAEAQYRGLPPPIAAVGKAATEMGEATVRSARSSAGAIKLMADGLDDVQRKMNAIVQADKDKAAADKAARAAANAASVTTQIVGRVTPLSEREAADTARLEQWIADLTRRLAASGPVSGAGPGAVAAAQQRADDERQLEYLRTLLEVATAMERSAERRATSPINVTVQASGFFDPASKRQLAAAISEELMSTLKLGRQLGTG